ncbi:MAG: PKD domain-containing protein [Bacteroidetes bacterium]|nr:PKD domain-containing protein [Bacteroidota bacterium]
MKNLCILLWFIVAFSQNDSSAQTSSGSMSISPSKSGNDYEVTAKITINAKVAVNTITTSTISPFFYCKGSTVTVPFTIAGTFNSDNVFTAQLSDAGGSFASPTSIGTLNGTSQGVINATIPLNTPDGGGYRIRVVGSSPSTTGTDNGNNLAMNPLPVVYSITGNNSYCAGGNGVVIGLSFSDVGVKYQLKRDGSNVGTEVTGNFLPINFGLQTVVGTYTVIATYSATGCTQKMADSINLVVNPLPLQYTVTGGGSYCSEGDGLSIGLSNSQVGITYQLLRYGVDIGVTAGGTGDVISFGKIKPEGNYTVMAKNATTNCSQIMNGSATIIIYPSPTQYDVIGGGTYCEGDKGVQVILYSSDTSVSYQLKVDGTNTGSPKSGTGLALEFGLQKQPGNYTVEATNTKTGCKAMMSSSKNVIRNPLPPKPTITKVGNDLSSSESAGNQWYMNSQIIVGATAKTYTPTASGSYSVIVTLKGCPSEVSNTIDITINSDKLAVGINADVKTGTAPLIVKFSDASTGKPKSWNWDFGDTQTSFEQNPTHTYSKSGSYSVTLKISDGTATDTKTFPAYIVVTDSSSVVVDFTVASASGKAPLTVQFTDMSVGSPTAWEWNFGDGSNFATVNSPEHTYMNAGKYSVTLTVTKDGKQFSATKKDFITVDSASIGVGTTEYFDNKISLIPNPSNGSGVLSYTSGSSQKIILKIYSVLGELMYRNELAVVTGQYSFPLDKICPNFATGIYYITIQYSNGTLSQIMQIVK